MRAAINDLKRRAEQARRLANGVTSCDNRDNLLASAREYDRQVKALEQALNNRAKVNPVTDNNEVKCLGNNPSTLRPRHLNWTRSSRFKR